MALPQSSYFYPPRPNLCTGKQLTSSLLKNCRKKKKKKRMSGRSQITWSYWKETDSRSQDRFSWSIRPGEAETAAGCVLGAIQPRPQTLGYHLTPHSDICLLNLIQYKKGTRKIRGKANRDCIGHTLCVCSRFNQANVYKKLL